jgi:predicted RNA-binding Zn ribbon-like protein
VLASLARFPPCPREASERGKFPRTRARERELCDLTLCGMRSEATAYGSTRRAHELRGNVGRISLAGR